MNTKAKLALAALAALALGAAGGASTQGGGASGPPQRTPTPNPGAPPGKPPTDNGEEQGDDDEGRVWRTWYVNRDEVKNYEMVVLSVALDPDDPSVGTGEVVADVFESVEGNGANASIFNAFSKRTQLGSWMGVACSGHRWRLKFDKGRLVSVTQSSAQGGLPCAGVRPTETVYLRTLSWVQRGPDVVLTMRTGSGLSKAAVNPANRPLNSGKDRWDNDAVRSGDVVVDVSWVFNPS
jgi:hypothetical protein